MKSSPNSSWKTAVKSQIDLGAKKTSEIHILFFTLNSFELSEELLYVLLKWLGHSCLQDKLGGDALWELSIHCGINWNKPLKATFDGEEAVEAGDATKEFFLLLLQERVNPIYEMYMYY